MINDICDFNNENQFCNKCYLTYKSKNEFSNVYIFNKINDIIYGSKTMPEVYYKIDNLNVDFNKWIEKNIPILQEKLSSPEKYPIQVDILIMADYMWKIKHAVAVTTANCCCDDGKLY